MTTNPQSKESNDREDLLDRIVAEYADRAEAGDPAIREDYYQKYPELRDELDRCFRMIDAGGGEHVAAPSSLTLGNKLGDFTILREIGRGGMGVVYLAEQKGLDRKVALKVLRHHLTLEARHVSRFEREARAAARLRHPNIVAIHSVGEADGHYYISMDYIPGPTLADVIESLRKLGRKPTAADLAKLTKNRTLESSKNYSEAAVRLFLPILDAVAAAHAAGTVHRDLKPSNILIDNSGAAHVADFGLAKGEGDLGLSMSGEPIGTPYYMAPEQVRAATKTTDARTDVYSLGVTLYEMLTLERPFEAPSYPELVTKILNVQARRPRNVDGSIPKNLERVVLQAIHKDPAKRYTTVIEFSQDLSRAIAGGRVLAKNPWFYQMNTGFGGGMASGRNYFGQEYKSSATIFGIPWIHIANGYNPETGRPYVAKGIIAIGNIAIGVFAFGGIALGGVSFGGLSLGLLLAIGGCSIGGVAIGGFAAGAIAFGGVSIGYYACGGAAIGAHVWTAQHTDPAARQFFEALLPQSMIPQSGWDGR
ncbi:MAG: serine/threonine-protein kinase [Planctomycetota bacterium]